MAAAHREMSYCSSATDDRSYSLYGSCISASYYSSSSAPLAGVTVHAGRPHPGAVFDSSDFNQQHRLAPGSHDVELGSQPQHGDCSITGDSRLDNVDDDDIG